MATVRVGMEIGDHRVSMGIVDEHGSILSRRVFSGNGVNSPERFTETLCDHLEDMLLKHGLLPGDVEHIGLGVAGVVDISRGVVEYSPAMFGEREVALAKLVEERVGVLPTVARTDWAAASAEMRFGLTRRLDDFLCVTLGKTVGCAVVLGGKIYPGAMRTAGELGHMIVEPEGRACPCGQRGCLDRYIGSGALVELARERFPERLPAERVSVRDVFALAEGGDADALSLIGAGVDRLAFALANAVNLLGMDTIVLAGVLSEQQALVIDPLRQKLPAYGHPSWAKRRAVTVRQAALGGDSAMVGAAFITEAELRPEVEA